MRNRGMTLLELLLILVVVPLIVAIGFVITQHIVPLNPLSKPQVSVYPERNWVLYTQPIHGADPTLWHPTRQYKTFEQCAAVMESINNAGKQLADCAR